MDQQIEAASRCFGKGLPGKSKGGGGVAAGGLGDKGSKSINRIALIQEIARVRERVEAKRREAAERREGLRLVS